MKNSHLDLFGNSNPIQFKRTGNIAYKFSWGIPVKRNKVLQSEGNNKRSNIFLEVILKNRLSTFSSTFSGLFLSGVSDHAANSASDGKPVSLSPHSLQRAPDEAPPLATPPHRASCGMETMPGLRAPSRPHLPCSTSTASVPAGFPTALSNKMDAAQTKPENEGCRCFFYFGWRLVLLFQDP